MGCPILILGKSGSGKSTSLRNFKHDEVAVVNVMDKPMPFKGKFDSMAATTNYEDVKQLLFKTDKKAIVIDDFGYMMTNHLMQGKDAGGNKYDLFDDIASKPWNLLEWVRKRLPEDKIVYFIMHEDYNESGGVKPKTIGKMTDDKICLEGLFTVVLRCVFKDDKHIFQTHMRGDDVTKSPMGMFEEDEIDNDLRLVDEKIREYYSMKPLKEK